MTTSEHIEVDALLPGMPVVVGGREFGSVQNVVPQADRRHVLRLIVRRHADSRLVAIPIEWARGIRDGTLELWVTRAELDDLPEYVPPISASEARERVERALHEHPATSASGIRVTDRDGTLELRGEVADRAGRSTASAVARSVPGIGPLRNLIGTATEPEVPAAGYGYHWLRTLFERATALDLDQAQLTRIEEIAEHKLVDLFDVAEDTAVANGRTRVLRQDLPLTKGLQTLLLEVADFAREVGLDGLLIFLADAGIRTPFDEGLQSEVPRLIAALLILTGRLVELVETLDGPSSAVIRPSSRGLDAASTILDLTS
jgi:hypothetical protein